MIKISRKAIETWNRGEVVKKGDTIENIRSFNRFYTDLLGLLNKHILDSKYSLTEVRILFEIDKTINCTANLLMDKLDIDRGYMSRILKKFESEGLIIKKGSSTDGRKLFLYLTPPGKDELTALEGKSDKQVLQIIGHLAEDEREKLVSAMKYIKNSLSEGIRPVTIRTYQQKDLEYIIKRHRELYETEYGFSPAFGDYVQKYLLEFHEHHDRDRENIWVAEADNAAVGVIALVKVDDTTAQLRWFLVEPEMRGRGLGHKLMKIVMSFCKEKNYKHVVLWTVSVLDAARHLYSQYGFERTETKKNDTWGDDLTEERWDAYL